MAVMTGSARIIIDLLFTVILLGSYIFLKMKKESACVINFVIGVTTVCFLLGSQLSPVVLFALTAILMIIASLTLSTKIIIYYYMINLAYIIILFIISQQNPDIQFYFDESLNNVIIIYSVIFFLSLIISIRLFGTIKYQKQQNEELVKKKKELVNQRNHLDDLVKEKTKELLQSNKELNEYVYKISHELKTPIISISNFISLFLKKKKQDLDSSSLHYFDRININIDELKVLIDEILENYGSSKEPIILKIINQL
jgi:signal transduction histidine kinase